MFQRVHARVVRRLAAALLAIAMAAAPARADELRTILATGDDVAGLGRIGRWGLRLVLLDDSGRALISRVDGLREESVWADTNGFAPLLDGGADTGVDLIGYDVVGSRAGTVAGFGYRRSLGAAYGQYIYAVAGGRTREVVRRGDLDPDGYRFCEIHTPLVNASGAVAFSAIVTPSGYKCPDLDSDGDTTPVYEGLYLADGTLRRLGGTGPLAVAGWDAPSFTPFALSDRGEAIILEAAGEERRVLAVGVDGVRVLYRVGDADAPGVIGRGAGYGFDVLTANGSGAVLFRRIDGERAGLYRALGGQVQAIAREGDPAPWGAAYTVDHAYAYPKSINDRGDVLLVFDQENRAVSYPVDDAPRIFTGRLIDGSLNNRGDVALLAQTSDESLEVVRHRGAEQRRLAATGDRLPSGDTLAARGLIGGCLAPDGAVATTALTTNGDAALICGDRDGFTPVTRMGDGRPEGRRFHTFERCAFGAPGQLYFVGTSLAPSGRPRSYFSLRGVYRASGDRLERVLGSGAELSDGSAITALPDPTSVLEADPSGRLLTTASTNGPRGTALLIAHPDGTLERLPLRLRNYGQPATRIGFAPDSSIDHEYLAGSRSTPSAPSGASVARLGARVADQYDEIGAVWVSEARLAASGGAFVLGSKTTADPEYGVADRSVVLYVDSRGAREIAGPGNGTTSGPYRFDALQVRGDRVVFSLLDGAGRSILRYTLGDDAPQAIITSGTSSPAGTLRYPSPIALGPDGRVYFTDTPDGAASRLVLVWQDGLVSSLGSADFDGIWSAAANDAGALLLPASSRLQLAGPGAGDSSCPHPPAIVPPTLAPVPPPPGATPPPGVELPFDPAECIPGSVCLFVGSTSVPAGDEAAVDVYLRDDGQPVAAVQNDLQLPPMAHVTGCVAGSETGKSDTAFSITDERTRAVVISFSNVDPIANDALLYSCTIAVDAGAAPGYYPITCAQPGSSTEDGVPRPTSCADGVLTVSGIDSGNAAQSGPSASSGCAVQPQRDESAWLLLAAALLLSLARRHRRC